MLSAPSVLSSGLVLCAWKVPNKKQLKWFNIFLLCCCYSLHSHVQLFVTPWTEACQASLSFTISENFLKLLSIESVMPSNHSSFVVPFSSCLQSFWRSGSFPMSQLFASNGQNIGASVSASVLLMNIQDWFPLGLTSLILLLSKGLSRVFSNTAVQKHQLFGTQPSLWSNSHICKWLLEKP